MGTLAIINPHSGDRDDLSQVASLVRNHPDMGRPDVRITNAPNDARLLARTGTVRGFRRIIAVGGDGTLNEVVNGILEAVEGGAERPLLGLLPMGTGNDFARSLGIPLDLEEALDVLGSLVPRAVDVVRVEGGVEGGAQRYLINASAGGFSGEVDETMTRERKRNWGPFAYARGALDLLPDPTGYQAQIEIDGETRTLRVLNVVVANGRTVAGGVPVAPKARVHDGLLDVVIVLESEKGSLAGFASRCLVGNHLDHDLTEFVQAERVVIRSEPDMRFNLDGELVGKTPLEYTVVPGALEVLAARDGPGFGT